MEKKNVTVLSFFVKEGAYGIEEYEIPAEILKKHGKKVKSPEPDIFAIFVNNLTKRSRELLGI